MFWSHKSGERFVRCCEENFLRLASTRAYKRAMRHSSVLLVRYNHGVVHRSSAASLFAFPAWFSVSFFSRSQATTPAVGCYYNVMLAFAVFGACVCVNSCIRAWASCVRLCACLSQRLPNLRKVSVVSGVCAFVSVRNLCLCVRCLSVCTAGGGGDGGGGCGGGGSGW